MIIVFAIVTCIVLIVLAIYADSNWPDWITILFIVLILATIGGSVFANNRTCNIPTGTNTLLYAGYNNTELHGQFFLGSGSVDETDMVYYWINDNGVKSKHSKKMDESVFIEDGKNMMVEIFYTCPSNLRWLFVDHGYGKTEFHVPENSIVQMYQYH